MSIKRPVSKKDRPNRNSVGKSVSIRGLKDKVADIIKKSFTKSEPQKAGTGAKRKPFGGKGGRKPKMAEDELRRAEAAAKIEKIENEPVEPTEAEQSYSSVASAFSGFFYTDEKFITQFEDREILEYVRAVHPEYDPRSGDESVLKKAVISILNDSKFMSRLMDMYNMTIFDFFKFLFRMEPSIFKGAFISKI